MHHNFRQIGYGKNADEAYEQLCAEAKILHGTHDYNGSISTTLGYSESTLGESHFTKEAIFRWTTKMWATAWLRDCYYLQLPKSFAKGKGRGVQAFLFVGKAATGGK